MPSETEELLNATTAPTTKRSKTEEASRTPVVPSPAMYALEDLTSG